jgi:hypothetical protein
LILRSRESRRRQKRPKAVKIMAIPQMTLQGKRYRRDGAGTRRDVRVARLWRPFGRADVTRSSYAEALVASYKQPRLVGRWREPAHGRMSFSRAWRGGGLVVGLSLWDGPPLPHTFFTRTRYSIPFKNQEVA